MTRPLSFRVIEGGRGVPAFVPDAPRLPAQIPMPALLFAAGVVTGVMAAATVAGAWWWWVGGEG